MRSEYRSLKLKTKPLTVHCKPSPQSLVHGHVASSEPFMVVICLMHSNAIHIRHTIVFEHIYKLSAETHIQLSSRHSERCHSAQRQHIGSGEAATSGACNIKDGMGMPMAVAIGICACTSSGGDCVGCSGFLPLDFRGL
jgi:hypothetical protein